MNVEKQIKKLAKSARRSVKKYVRVVSLCKCGRRLRAGRTMCVKCQREEAGQKYTREDTGFVQIASKADRAAKETEPKFKKVGVKRFLADLNDYYGTSYRTTKEYYADLNNRANPCSGASVRVARGVARADLKNARRGRAL